VTGAPGAACVGSISDPTLFWGPAAKSMSWKVYCATWLPAHWYLGGEAESAYYNHAVPGGQLIAHYGNSAHTANIYVKEGGFCTSGVSACSGHDTNLGTASFGDMPGTLYSLGPSLGYAIYINPGTTHGYTITGDGLTQALFVQIASKLAVVPKP
jgi:hypothetical protein